MSVRSVFPVVQCSSQPCLRTARRITRPSVVGMRARELVFAGGLAWRAAQRKAKRKKERPAKKRVGTLKKKRKVAGRAAKCEGGGSSAGGCALHEREKRNGGSCAMMVSPSVLWVRTRAGVRVLVVCEDAAGWKTATARKATAQETTARALGVQLRAW